MPCGLFVFAEVNAVKSCRSLGSGGKSPSGSGHPPEDAIVYNADIGTIVTSGDRPVKVRSVGLDRNERGCGSFFRNHLMNLRAKSGWISHFKESQTCKTRKK